MFLNLLVVFARYGMPNLRDAAFKKCCPLFPHKDNYMNVKTKTMPSGEVVETRMVTSHTVRTQVNHLKTKCNVHVEKVTHAGRHFLNRLLQHLGISDDQRRRACRWADQARANNTYSDEFYVKLTTLLAQCGADLEPSLYNPWRTNIRVPDDLLKLLWPELDKFAEELGISHYDPQKQEGLPATGVSANTLVRSSGQEKVPATVSNTCVTDNSGKQKVLAPISSTYAADNEKDDEATVA
jgi:hypothetical protein